MTVIRQYAERCLTGPMTSFFFIQRVMEKHEDCESNNEDIEDIEVDVVSTAATPSVTEIEDGDSNHKDTTQEKSDQATETGNQMRSVD